MSAAPATAGVPAAAPSGERFARVRRVAAVAPACGAVALLFGGALAGALRASIVPAPSEGLGGLTLAAWGSALSDPAFADALWLTARTTVIATAVSAALAVAVALALRPYGTVLRAAFALPVPVPHLLVAVAAVLWLAPGGIAERALGSVPVDLVRDRAGLGIVAVYVYKEAPFIALLVLAAAGQELARREEAAAVFGAGPWQRLRWVVWPAIRVPLVVGSLIVAAFVFGAFEVPLAVGPNYPPTLAVLALEAAQTAALDGQARAAAALLVAAAASIAMAVAAVRLVRRADG